MYMPANAQPVFEVKVFININLHFLYEEANDCRRKSTAFTATITVESDMRTAPIAGLNTIPQATATPAASGMATILYPVAQKRF